MQAITVRPGTANEISLREMPDPQRPNGMVLIRALALGICGTDREIIRGEYGVAPAGAEHLILGHESLGEVLEAPDGSDVAPGDHVVGIVRQPDPVPCPNCSVGEWDMCRNGRYKEHGIKELHGFGAERYALHPERMVPVEKSLGVGAVLLEPTSVVAKAWEQIERIGARMYWRPGRVLITGAGPIGLLAALLGTQRRLEVHVLDRVTDGPKPALVRALGGTYHSGRVRDLDVPFDAVLECTGVGPVLADVLPSVAPNGVVCLTGVSSGQEALPVNLEKLNRKLVLENIAVLGTVNANRRHYQQAAAALAHADRGWLEALMTRRVPLADWSRAFSREGHDIKTVLVF